ncbi:MAG: alkene reductase [Methylophilaceae bacterium]
MTNLFSPVILGRIALPNRIVMAPLTRNRAAMPGNLIQDMNVTYYAQRASAGLIITEATPICAMSHGYPALPGIYNAEQVAGWKCIVDAVHAKGGRIVLQLWHVGRIAHPSLLPDNALPVAPSAIKPAGQAYTYEGFQDFVTPRALEIGELAGIVQEYKTAAEYALAAGFDGVEVHSANGYLLDQFLRDASNKRTDQYGGSIPNRTRLLLEVMATVCKVWGSDRVGVRISPINSFNDMQDSNPQALFNHVADVLSPFNLAYLHVVEVGIGATEVLPDFDFAALRRAFKGNYMANGGYDKARGNAAIASGHADCVAFGVPFIANPDLVARYAKDAPLNEADQSSFYGGTEKGYIDYPSLA